MSKGRNYREIPSPAQIIREATTVTNDYQPMTVRLKHKTVLPSYDEPRKDYSGWWSPSDPWWVIIAPAGHVGETIPEGKPIRVPQSDVEWAR